MIIDKERIEVNGNMSSFGLNIKGELEEQHCCRIDLSNNISISDSGNFILFYNNWFAGPNKIFDYKNRLVKISYGYSGEEFYEFSYFGDFISGIVYQYSSLSPEYYSFSYENGRLVSASGPKGQFKVNYDIHGEVIRP
ncbi:MAG: hypothetical protein J6A47_02050 [Bacilli bacterium]|nr:hypothetical protein [Bacilli bacterium]